MNVTQGSHSMDKRVSIKQNVAAIIKENLIRYTCTLGLKDNILYFHVNNNDEYCSFSIARRGGLQ